MGRCAEAYGGRGLGLGLLEPMSILHRSWVYAGNTGYPAANLAITEEIAKTHRVTEYHGRKSLGVSSAKFQF